ncbi:MAG: S41 family peptidase [Chitinispirillaceae bacterium]
MRLNSLSLLLLTCLSGLITSGCFGVAPEEDEKGLGPHTEQTVSEEMDFCWDVLSNYFIYQERLPEDPFNTFSSPGPLFESVGDPYTMYIPPLYADEFYSQFTTVDGGIGFSLDSVASGYVIADVYDDSPAEKAGLEEGDTVVSIDGVSLQGLAQNALTEITSGEIGEMMEIGLAREDFIKYITVELGEFLAPSVKTDSLDANTVMITLDGFLDETEMAGGSSEEIRQALQQTVWAENLILDLRENGGGMMNQCVDIVSQFLPEDTPIVRVQKRDLSQITHKGYTSDTTYYTIGSEGLGRGRNIHILVSDHTASASEILVSVLREQLSSKIYGMRTYGKGSGWYPFHTPEGGGATVTGMLINPIDAPSYNEVGIEPDVVINGNEDALDVAYQQVSDGAFTKRRRVSPAVSWAEKLGPRIWRPALIID